MTQILNVRDYWGATHEACAYLHWPRLKKIMIFEPLPINTLVEVIYETGDDTFAEHFNVYPTPSGYPQFVLNHD